LPCPKEKNTEAQKSEVLNGTLDLMASKVLDELGPLMGTASPAGSIK
jgi:hypothetical protein